MRVDDLTNIHKAEYIEALRAGNTEKRALNGVKDIMRMDALNLDRTVEYEFDTAPDLLTAPKIINELKLAGYGIRNGLLYKENRQYNFVEFAAACEYITEKGKKRALNTTAKNALISALQMDLCAEHPRLERVKRHELQQIYITDNSYSKWAANFENTFINCFGEKTYIDWLASIWGTITGQCVKDRKWFHLYSPYRGVGKTQIAIAPFAIAANIRFARISSKQTENNFTNGEILGNDVIIYDDLFGSASHKACILNISNIVSNNATYHELKGIQGVTITGLETAIWGTANRPFNSDHWKDHEGLSTDKCIHLEWSSNKPEHICQDMLKPFIQDVVPFTKDKKVHPGIAIIYNNIIANSEHFKKEYEKLCETTKKSLFCDSVETLRSNILAYMETGGEFEGVKTVCDLLFKIYGLDREFISFDNAKSIYDECYELTKMLPQYAPGALTANAPLTISPKGCKKLSRSTARGYNAFIDINLLINSILTQDEISGAKTTILPATYEDMPY